MRCNICDSDLAEPTFNKELGSWEPCGTCLAVIYDTIAGYRDRTSVDDDELGMDELGEIETVISLEEIEEYQEVMDFHHIL